MLIENDFEHDDGHRQPDAPDLSPAPAAGRDPVSQPGHPPVAHPPRPDPRGGPRLPGAPTDDAASARPRPTSRPRRGRGSASRGRARRAPRRRPGRFLARGESSATPALDPVGPPPPEPPAEPATAPAPGPSPDVAIAEEDPMPPPPEPEHVDEATAETPAPADPAAPGPDPSAGPVPPPPPPEPALTKEQVLDRIRLEAEQKAARLRSPRSLEAAAAREGSEARRGDQGGPARRGPAPGRGEAGRVPRRAPQARRRAGRPRGARRSIASARNTAGSPCPRSSTRSRRGSAGHPRDSDGADKVEMMRRLGLPEPIILDALTRDASRSLKTRGGPRNMDEVRALAGRQLLAIPPAPPRARAATKPVAEASMAPVPGAGRRPQ